MFTISFVVGDEQAAVGRERQSVNALKVELRIRFFVENQLNITVGIEELDAIVVVIGHGQVTIGVDTYAERATELAGFAAGLAELVVVVAEAVEYLHAVIELIGHGHAIARDRDEMGIVELPVMLSFVAPFQEKASVDVQFLHAIVHLIANVHVARGIRGHTCSTRVMPVKKNRGVCGRSYPMGR